MSILKPLGSIQVLRQQLFPDFGPPTPPCVSSISTSLDPPPPLICWRNTWTEGELLDDFHDMFQIIKIYFSIIVRNIFWGVFKEIRAWFRKKFISLLITSSIWPQILALCFNSPTLSLPSVSMSAFWLRPPHPPPKRQQYQHFGSDPPPPPNVLT